MILDDLGCQMARVVLIFFCHLKLKKNVELHRIITFLSTYICISRCDVGLTKGDTRLALCLDAVRHPLPVEAIVSN